MTLIPVNAKNLNKSDHGPGSIQRMADTSPNAPESSPGASECQREGGIATVRAPTPLFVFPLWRGIAPRCLIEFGVQYRGDVAGWL
jgi:hypothetical protein